MSTKIKQEIESVDRLAISGGVISPTEVVESMSEKEEQYGSMPTKEQIIIPDGVKRIANFAFFHKNVGTVLCGSYPTVTRIGIGAFEGNRGLSIMIFPLSLRSIGAFAFEGTRLDCARLLDKLRHIEDSAFMNCKSLRVVITGRSLLTIGKDAFRGDENLEEITFTSDKIRSISPSAFWGCPKLKRIIVPESLLEKYKGLLSRGLWKKLVTKPDSEMLTRCCICGMPMYKGYGNNPWPVHEDGVCCGDCDKYVVFPARCRLWKK